MRVLIAEDEAALSSQLAAAIGRAGYAVDIAADGVRAEYLAHTEQYDAVVLDLGLPGIDGLTLLRTWRTAGLNVPVLVLTARGATEGTRGRTGAAGAISPSEGSQTSQAPHGTASSPKWRSSTWRRQDVASA